MTVLDVIQRSTDFLAEKGVESPRLQVELLLAHVLQLPRLNLYLNFERTLTEAELEALRGYVKRRGRREPLQHILGSVSFCGYELKVTPAVMIPRPETELLAERAWQILERLIQQECEPVVLDYGTGSGCLAIVLAARFSQVRAHAVEISPEALEVARENARRHQVEQRIEFRQGDGFVALPKGVRLDLIVANPPYIARIDLAGLQPEVRDFDPHRALDGGEDGLDHYRRLAGEAADWLKEGGKLLMEFGDHQEEPLCAIFREPSWRVEEVINDYRGRPRLLQVSPAKEG